MALGAFHCLVGILRWSPNDDFFLEEEDGGPRHLRRTLSLDVPWLVTDQAESLLDRRVRVSGYMKPEGYLMITSFGPVPLLPPWIWRRMLRWR